MPNLVGIGLSQVPTNSMLGGLAYQDPEHASIKDLDLKNLSQINSEIANTAVDVFVYDTRKDSDGGAWRKRTQHTSWYNETLNTATRGSRREFPAVAVLVLEGTVFTIYDGDDPDLPMWMVFNKASNSYFSITTNSCVTALNGKIVSGGNASNDRLRVIDFLLDNELEYSHTSGQRTHVSPISGRNGTAGFAPYDSSLPGVINRYINDVAMTVLPSAPIDDATGLPVPTIAVATNGGVSVIKDDGNVYDASDTSSFGSVDFTFHDGIRLVNTRTDTGTGLQRYFISQQIDTISADGWNLYDYYTGNFAAGYPRLRLEDNGAGVVSRNGDDGTVLGSNVGLALWYVKSTDITSSGSYFTNSLMCFTSSSFNTGWMHGDIKGAFLSDTDTTNITGSDLVTNGTFDTDSDWSKASHWTISGGAATMPSTGSYKPFFQYNLGTTSGTKYVATIDVTAISGTIKFDTASSDGGGISAADGILITTTGTHTLYFVATPTQDGIGVARYEGTTSSCTIDNITVRIAETDRSVNDKGFRVFGTITKSAVATGAELVSYGPFSSSNYLEQPYNSDLDFGTGDYYFTYWMNSPSLGSDQSILQQGDYSQDKGIFTLVHNSSGTGNSLLVGDGGATVTVQNHEGYGWIQIFAVRNNGQLSVYRNGVLQGTANSSRNINYSSSSHNKSLVIGAMYSNGSLGYVYGGNLALFRVGASAPTAEQIKKIYEDEKFLFQENSKATLYGSSDNVTAIAYDDSTNLLYAGTSAGRSEFQGLRRINNTTEAVTTAISASNGLVAEQ